MPNPKLTFRPVRDAVREFRSPSMYISVPDWQERILCITVQDISMVGACHILQYPEFQYQRVLPTQINFATPAFFVPDSWSFLPEGEAVEIVREWFSLSQDVAIIMAQEFLDEGIPDEEAKSRAADIASAFFPLAARKDVEIAASVGHMVERAFQLQSYLDHQEIRTIGEHLFAVVNANIEPPFFNQPTKAVLEDRNALRRVANINPLDGWWFTGRYMSFRNFDRDMFPSRAGGRMLERVLNSELPDETLGRYGTIRAITSVSARSLHEFLLQAQFSKLFWFQRGEYQFTDWYLEQLPHSHRERVATQVETLLKRVKEMGPPQAIQAEPHDWSKVDSYNRSAPNLLPDWLLYLLPAGTSVDLEMTGDLGACLRLLKLFSGQENHPEIRSIAQSWIRYLACELGVPPTSLGDMTDEAGRGDTR